MKQETGRITLPKGSTVNERAKAKACYPAATAKGPLESLLTESRRAGAHCQMCGAASNHYLEPAFDPDGKPKILCQLCRIGSAELLMDRALSNSDADFRDRD